jgi:2-iminobutanoate/2-iminopropanoate deaminase
MAEKEDVAFGPFKDFIADGVRMGDTIHLSGSVSVGDQGQTLHAGDIVKQAQQAYAHIAKVLGKFGATMDNIMCETLFITDMSAVMGDQEKMGAFFGARAEAYGGNPQVSQSLIGVSELAAPDLMIEIKVVAHV